MAFTWKRVTEERYWDALEALPPIGWTVARGFLLGEPWCGKRCTITNNSDTFAYSAFARRNGEYFECQEPMTIAEWRAFDVSTMTIVEDAPA